MLFLRGNGRTSSTACSSRAQSRSPAGHTSAGECQLSSMLSRTSIDRLLSTLSTSARLPWIQGTLLQRLPHICRCLEKRNGEMRSDMRARALSILSGRTTIGISTAFSSRVSTDRMRRSFAGGFRRSGSIDHLPIPTHRMGNSLEICYPIWFQMYPFYLQRTYGWFPAYSHRWHSHFTGSRL